MVLSSFSSVIFEFYTSDFFDILGFVLKYVIPGPLELFLVDLRKLRRLLKVLPIITVDPCVHLESLALRHDVAYGREKRYQDKVYECWLPLRN